MDDSVHRRNTIFCRLERGGEDTGGGGELDKRRVEALRVAPWSEHGKQGSPGSQGRGGKEELGKIASH